MTARVIQGSFLASQPKLPPPIPSRLPPPILAKTAARPPGPPASTFGGHPPGPPMPVFAGRQGMVQRQGAGGAFAVEAGQVGLISGGGRPLPEAVRGKMEAALGASFADVRVHVGPQAERIGAIAFTLGSDIYFAPGRFQPDTVHGQQLLGHELAHVVQQRAGRVRNPLGSGLAVVQDHALEAEADRLGRHAAAKSISQPRSVQRSAPRDFRVVKLPGRVRIEALGQDRLTPVGGVELRHAASGIAELCNLRVAEPHRRQHVGSGLVRKAVETARSAGARSVVLEARPGDRGTDAGALASMYRKLGFRPTGRSAAGNTVMQRAIPAPPSAGALRADRGGVLQRMDAPLGKDRSARILELMGEAVDDQTIAIDVASVCQKVKRWAPSQINLTEQGRDLIFYDKAAWASSWFSTVSVTDVLMKWNPNDNPYDTAAMLMDYALAWQREGRGRAWREEHAATRRKPESSKRLMAIREEQARGEDHTFDMSSSYGLLAQNHNYGTKSGPSASTAQLMWMLRKVGTITQREAKSVGHALTQYWNRSFGLKGTTGEYHTKFEVMIPLARHHSKFLAGDAI